MAESERIQNARIEKEAREAVVHRTARGPVSREIEAAMMTYLAAEADRELKKDRDETSQGQPPRRRSGRRAADGRRASGGAER